MKIFTALIFMLVAACGTIDRSTLGPMIHTRDGVINRLTCKKPYNQLVCVAEARKICQAKNETSEFVLISEGHMKVPSSRTRTAGVVIFTCH